MWCTSPVTSPMCNIFVWVGREKVDNAATEDLTYKLEASPLFPSVILKNNIIC